MQIPHRHRLIHDTRLTTNSTFNCWQWRAGPALGLNIAMAQVYCSSYPTRFTLSAYQFGVWIFHHSGPQIVRSHHSAHRYPLLFYSTITALLDIITAWCMWHVRLRLSHRGLEVYVTVVPREWKGIRFLDWEVRSKGETYIASHRHSELHNPNHI